MSHDIEKYRARSSAVEHFGDIEGVIGSNPIAPTKIKHILNLFYVHKN